jgi:hypothetical protein
LKDSTELITNPAIVAAIIGAVGTIIAALINKSKTDNYQAPPLPRYPNIPASAEPRQKRRSRFVENLVALVMILVVLGVYGEKGLYILGGLLGGALFAIIAWHLIVHGR